DGDRPDVAAQPHRWHRAGAAQYQLGFCRSGAHRRHDSRAGDADREETLRQGRTRHRDVAVRGGEPARRSHTGRHHHAAGEDEGAIMSDQRTFAGSALTLEWPEERIALATMTRE